MFPATKSLADGLRTVTLRIGKRWTPFREKIPAIDFVFGFSASAACSGASPGFNITRAEWISTFFNAATPIRSKRDQSLSP